MGPLDVAHKASDLRATVQMKAPDAIRNATAIVHGATAFLTNDRILEKVKEIEVLTLVNFLKTGSIPPGVL